MLQLKKEKIHPENIKTIPSCEDFTLEFSEGKSAPIMMLASFFKSEGIEHFAVLDYNCCISTAPHIMEREPFTPRSVIIYLLPYYVSDGENLSTYATSLDYHIAIGEVNCRLQQTLLSSYPDASVKGYGDHSPIDERHAALIGGLGVLGKNGLLINETYGSYCFIGDMITDIPPALLGSIAPQPVRSCRGCGACLAACPTGILRGEGGYCLSFATQQKGELTPEAIALMRSCNTVWGCDECQRHCPHNHSPKPTPIPFFHRDRITLLTTSRLATLDRAALRAQAFGWRGREVLLRNLAHLDY